MSRILLAWELGAGLGHIQGLLPLAVELKARGHAPLIALKELTHAEALISPYDIPFCQAPLWLAPSNGPLSPMSYAEILQGFGFLEPSRLTGIARAWRNLVEASRAELLVLDHAPTALLATSGMGLPRVRYGMGFTVPPRAAPVPSYIAWETVPSERLVQAEESVLATINQVSRVLGSHELASFYELFASEDDFLQTVPELDHYPERVEARYWGPLVNTVGGAAPAWPGLKGKKIFVYIKPQWPELTKLLHTLKHLRCSTLVYAPGLAEHTRKQFETDTLKFADGIVNIEQARWQADLAICHGNFGTATAFLLAGKPLLCIPLHMEQYILSQRIHALGAGIAVNMRSRNSNFSQIIRRLLDETSYTDAAQGFAGKYRALDHTAQIGEMADRIEQLLH
jgi:UDP:flavonoid glycosyltransferase YjiC (YdhE family)